MSLSSLNWHGLLAAHSGIVEGEEGGGWGGRRVGVQLYLCHPTGMMRMGRDCTNTLSITLP